MKTTRSAGSSELRQEDKLQRFQLGVVILCGLCLVLDGFDVQAIGYVAPAIVEAWKIPRADMGPVFGAGLLGVLAGSLLLSMIADKTGRRPVLIGSTLFFAIFTILAARAASVTQLLAFRFTAGLGLGCIMPNAMALVGENCPRRLRITLMMIVSCGFTAGAAAGGFLAAWLIPGFGWRSVFYAGGATPLVIAVLMFFFLPESGQFLTLQKKRAEMRAADPRLGVGSRALVAQAAPQAPRTAAGTLLVVSLFREGRASATLLLWIVNFLNLLNLYFLSNWLPSVVRAAGHPTSTAVLVGTALQVGGLTGTVALARIIERRGFIPVLSACFAAAGISVFLIGRPGLSLPMLAAAVFTGGFCVIGGQPAVNAWAATYYPTGLRSTGIGWSLGIGRIGGIVGPVLAGELLRLNWSARELFTAAAAPALVSAAVAGIMGHVVRPETDGDPEIPIF